MDSATCLCAGKNIQLTFCFILSCPVWVVGQYQDPWQYVDDIWVMFNNAWLYNRKTSRVYKYCSKLAEVFEQEIDPVMQSLGYCCGRKVRRGWINGYTGCHH